MTTWSEAGAARDAYYAERGITPTPPEHVDQDEPWTLLDGAPVGAVCGDLGCPCATKSGHHGPRGNW